jgi:anti-anti-sigma factor
VAHRDRRSAPPGWDGHLLLAHSSEGERRAGVAAWARHGLEWDEKVVYGERAREAPDRAVDTVLREYGVDAESARREGRLVVLPLPEFYASVTRPDTLATALDEGYTGVRTSAESRAALTMMSADEYTRVEGLVDDLVRGAGVSALCQYDSALLDAGWLGPAAAGHLRGVRERQLYTGDAGDAVVLGGRVDGSNDGLFAAVLRAAADSGSGVLRLDMSAVTMLSAQACRALVDATEGFRADGGEVYLVGVSGPVERTLRMLGLERVMHVGPAWSET